MRSLKGENMEIKGINRNTTPNFQAKFLNTEVLKDTVEYAVRNNKFDKLNQARKTIENYDVFTKIAVDLRKNEKTGADEFIFTSYIPKYNKNKKGEIVTEYKQISTTIPRNQKKSHYQLYQLLIKMSNNAPENKLYKKIVKGN